MTVSALIEELSRLSVELELVNGQLKVSAPRGVLTPELTGQIRERRAELLAVLEGASRAPRDLEPIPVAHLGEPAPLTPAQYQLWFLSQLDENLAMLNVPLTLRLRGPLSVPALTRAVTALGRRQDALCSRVEVREGMPVQVASERDLTLRFESYAELGAAEAERVAFARRAEELSRPLPLDQAPLSRLFLFEVSADDHLLVVVASHLICDGSSQDVLIRDLVGLYEHEVRGAPVPEAPRVRFADYARFHVGKARLGREQDVDYWKRRLGGMPSTIDIACDRPRPRRATHAATKCFAWVEPELCTKLRQVARARGATLSMLGLSCLEILLSRYAGQRDFGIGVPAEGRERAECENVVGMFVNTLVLRSDLGQARTFADLLAKVRESQIEALSHQNVPYDELHGLLGSGRDTQRAALFQVLFSYQELRPLSCTMADVTVEQIPSFTGSTLTDLTLWLRDHGDSLFLALEASADLYDAATTGRLFRSWQTILRAVAADPDLPLEQVPVLADEDAQHLLCELNATRAPWDDRVTVHGLFERAVDGDPNGTALIFEESSLSFRELDERANRLARVLVARGVQPESRVGLYLPRGLELIVGMLAILKAGGAYVGLDADYPPERVAQLLADSEAKVLLSTEGLSAKLSRGPELVLVDRDAAEIARESGDRLAARARPDNLAYVVYTSGSTGTPKGVMVEHRNVTSFFVGVERAIGLDGSGTWLASASICFDMSTIEILASLCHGCKVVVLGQAVLGEVADPRYAIPALVERHGITHFQCTPSQARMLALESSGRRALAALRQLLIGGEAVPQDLVDELVEIVSGDVIEVYGPTETTVYASASRPLARGLRATLGRPIANTFVFVLDEQRRPVPFGATGELYIGGPGVTRGYLDRPDLTAERFVPNTVEPALGDRLYKTGDLVRYTREGELLYLGRNDFQVKIRGYRIELGEIEAEIRALHGVTDVVVVARGEDGDKRLVAYVVTRLGYDGDESLRLHLRERLPEFMVPATIVHLDALPLNSNGKVDRAALPAPAEAEIRREYVAPRDEHERRLCRIWQEALGVPRVGLNDDFFDLGGHSLLAVKLSNEVYRSFGLRLPLATLFECPTVESFARRLKELASEPARAGEDAFTTLVKIQPRGSLPPFFCVAGVGGNPMNLRHLAEALGDDQPFYGLQFRGVDGRLPPHRSIHAMAEEFLTDIREVQPRGPYYLGGYSAGGLAAYETAQLLHAQGERAGLVVFFDTVNPVLPAWTWRERLEAHAENFVQRGVGYLSNRALARAREEVSAMVRAFRAQLAARYPFRFRHDAVRTASEEAIRRYHPRSLDADVLLVRADPHLTADGGIGHRPHESNGWRGLVLGDLTIVELACSHMNIVSEDASPLAAAALKKALAAARARQLSGSGGKRTNVTPLQPRDDGGVRLTG